jgi:general secretion pathway protein D
VAKGWQRPGRFVEPGIRTNDPTDPTSKAMANKLNAIVIPSVSFTGVDLGRVVSTLAALSTEYDTNPVESERGVNLVLGNQLAGTPIPQVNITLRNMSLKRILDIITENAAYQIEIQPDLVLLKPSGTDVNLVNEEFPVTKSAVTRMTGVGSGGSSTPAAAGADPFAAAPAAATPTASAGGESDAIRRFLQAAGVPFDSVPSASIAYDGSRILVTQTSRNIDRIRNILARYNDIRQVEIEAKFMEVSEGALDELGITWSAKGNGSPVYNTSTGEPLLNQDGTQTIENYKTTMGTVNRSMASAFTGSSSSGGGSISGPDGNLALPSSSPSIPGGIDLAGSALPLASINGILGEFDVTATLRALSQKSGTDLLSAPKVTVLSGNIATMTIAQELLYPESYGQTNSQVSPSSNSNTGSGGGGVTITPGAPNNFKKRNVGVELMVKPIVEEDDYSISLDLNPRVTEFEGFVEYGAQSIAIVPGTFGSTTVSTPSGFFQPIFSTREISTHVN